MNRHCVALLLVLGGAVPGLAQALEPEHEIRRLMLAAEEAVAAEQWGKAGEYLNRLQSMEGEKPPSYFYYRGRAMLHAGHGHQARASLERYVDLAGAEGQYYQQSLKLITDIEQQTSASVKSLAEGEGSGGNEPVAVIRPADEQDMQNLRKLYLADSDQQALNIHLNALLETAGWRRDSTIVRLDRPADIRYRVTPEKGRLNIQEIRRQPDGALLRTTQYLPVFGVNPQFRSDCEPVVGACWVYDPRDGSRLFQLTPDAQQASEVARTLGRLVRELQKVDPAQ